MLATPTIPIPATAPSFYFLREARKFGPLRAAALGAKWPENDEITNYHGSFKRKTKSPATRLHYRGDAAGHRHPACRLSSDRSARSGLHTRELPESNRFFCAGVCSASDGHNLGSAPHFECLYRCEREHLPAWRSGSA